jgi:uncharacterized protein YjbJ (UPF0337 family)
MLSQACSTETNSTGVSGTAAQNDISAAKETIGGAVHHGAGSVTGTSSTEPCGAAVQ